MRYGDDFWIVRPAEPLFKLGRRGSRFSVVWAVVALAGSLVVAGVVWYWFTLRVPPARPAAAELPMPAADPPAPAAVPPLDLPAVDASDGFVRDVVAGLSRHPQLARWLVGNHLARRIVGAVVSIAHHGSPAEHLAFMRPATDFTVAASGTRLVVDPASYARYNLVAETFASLDTEATARLFHQLEPLFNEVYREMGFADGSFQDALTRAMKNLMTVEIPSRPVGLVPNTAVPTTYAFSDPYLESGSPAEKHLLRMGPENARRVQEKLGELLPLLSR